MAVPDPLLTLQKLRADRLRIEHEVLTLAADETPDVSLLRAKRKKLDTTIAGIDALIADLVGGAESLKEPLPFGLLDSSVPLALLPVRLETRSDPNQPNVLRVRIYPDDIFVEDHEEGLTDRELLAGQTYWRTIHAAGSSPGDAVEHDAWVSLARDHGPRRALWIREQLRPVAQPNQDITFPTVHRKPSSWSEPARARCLPDRFVAIVVTPIGTVAHAGKPVPDTVRLGIDPQNDNLSPGQGSSIGAKIGLPADLHWLVDFEKATEIGLGIEVDTPAPVSAISEVIVLGVSPTLGREDARERLETLLGGHRHLNGVALLQRGTPTNNTMFESSGWSSYVDPHEGPPAAGLSPSDASNGSRIARALGIRPSRLDGIAGWGDNEEGHTRAMCEVLWPATWGHYLESLGRPGLDPRTKTGEELIRAVYGHFTGYVRGGGPLPTLLVGRQPYGLLPVTVTAKWKPNSQASDDVGEIPPKIVSFLQSLEPFWSAATRNVPHGFPGALTVQPHSRHVEARTIFGWSPAIAAYLDPNTKTPASQVIANWALLAETGLFSKPPGYAFQAKSPEATRVWLPMSSDSDSTLLDKTSQELVAAEPDTVLGVLVQQGLQRLEVGSTPWSTTLTAPDIDGVSLDTGFYFNTKPPRITFAFIDEPRASFDDARRTLAQLPTEERTRLTGETLDCCSHRYDAWITSIATRRLDQLRAAQPTGVQLGAWGYVSAARTKEAPNRAEGGFFLTPSAHHAATTAVLASAYQAHNHGDPDPTAPFNLDLSAPRVRVALELLDGVRAGIPLGTQLGHRLEASLHEKAETDGSDLEKYIWPLRREAPSRPPINTPNGGVPAPGSIDPSFSWQPCDGAEIVRVMRDTTRKVAFLKKVIPDPILDPDLGPGAAAKAKASVDADRVTLGDLIGQIDRDVDAVTDALFAEAVHQMVAGNHDKAGAVLDTIENGAPPPDDLEFIRTPTTGASIHQRFVLLLPNEFAGHAGWEAAAAPARTPRALAAPKLDAWVGHQLGDPRSVTCRRKGDPLKTVSLHRLGIGPLDLVFDTPPEGELIGPWLEYALSRHLPAPAGVAKGDQGWEVDASSNNGQSLRLVLQKARLMRRVLARRSSVDQFLFSPGHVPGVDKVEDADGEDASRVVPDPAPAESVRLISDLIDRLKELGSGQVSSPQTVTELLSYGLPGDPARPNVVEAMRQQALQRAAVARSVAPKGKEVSLSDLASALHELFGADFPAALPLKVADGASIHDQLVLQDKLLPDGDNHVVRWYLDYGQVRETVEAVGDLDLLNFSSGPVAVDRHLAFQAPLNPYPKAPAGKPDYPPQWVCSGDAFPATPLAAPSVTSWLVRTVDGLDLEQEVVGLILDEWHETVPSETITAAIAMNIDAPSSRPPNAILLAVPPVVGAPWTQSLLVDTIREAVRLAELRAVDLDATYRAPALLPAIHIDHDDLPAANSVLGKLGKFAESAAKKRDV